MQTRFLVVAAVVAVASGLVVDENRRCEDLKMIVHPAEVFPRYSVVPGFATRVVVPGLAGANLAGEAFRPSAGCRAEDLEEVRLLTAEDEPVFVVLGWGGDCGLDEKLRNLRKAGASGLILVSSTHRDDAASAAHLVGDQKLLMPMASISPSDLARFLRCRDAELHMVVLGEDMFYTSYGRVLQWTLIRGAAFWFSLQALICLATRVNRTSSFEQARDYMASRRAQIIQRLTSTIFLTEGPEGELMERGTTCAICLEDFVDGDHCRRLFCDHIYHLDCIDAWLRKSNECPLCKRSLPLLTASHMTAQYGATPDDL